MTEAEKSDPTAAQEKRAFERRRQPLPQPDFTPYKKANAYPGPSYFFVGHSYDVALSEQDSSLLNKRESAIGACFGEQERFIPVQKALDNQTLCQVLTRFEHDLLHRLPASALIGPAIDTRGNLIAQSFTVWREERRKPRPDKDATV